MPRPLRGEGQHALTTGRRCAWDRPGPGHRVSWVGGQRPANPSPGAAQGEKLGLGLQGGASGSRRGARSRPGRRSRSSALQRTRRTHMASVRGEGAGAWQEKGGPAPAPCGFPAPRPWLGAVRGLAYRVGGVVSCGRRTPSGSAWHWTLPHLCPNSAARCPVRACNRIPPVKQCGVVPPVRGGHRPQGLMRYTPPWSPMHAGWELLTYRSFKFLFYFITRARGSWRGRERDREGARNPDSLSPAPH